MGWECERARRGVLQLMPIVTTEGELREVLTRYHRIAVVGLSEKPYRPSYDVAQYLIRQGYEVIGVNPKLAGQRVLAAPVYGTLAELPEPPDIVDVFRRSEYVAEVADQAVRVGAKVLWTQLGVRDDTAAKRASESGLIVVQNRCAAVEHARLVAGRR